MGLLALKLTLPFAGLAAVFASLRLFYDGFDWASLLMVGLAVLLLWGMFKLIYELSHHKWIGGGDVDLAIGLALFAFTPVSAMLLLYIASLTGTIVALPLLFAGKKTMVSKLSFGPYLLFGCAIVVLAGDAIANFIVDKLFYL